MRRSVSSCVDAVVIFAFARSGYRCSTYLRPGGCDGGAVVRFDPPDERLGAPCEREVDARLHGVGRLSRCSRSDHERERVTGSYPCGLGRGRRSRDRPFPFHPMPRFDREVTHHGVRIGDREQERIETERRLPVGEKTIFRSRSGTGAGSEMARPRCLRMIDRRGVDRIVTWSARERPSFLISTDTGTSSD